MSSSALDWVKYVYFICYLFQDILGAPGSPFSNVANKVGKICKCITDICNVNVTYVEQSSDDGNDNNGDGDNGNNDAGNGNNGAGSLQINMVYLLFFAVFLQLKFL